MSFFTRTGRPAGCVRDEAAGGIAGVRTPLLRRSLFAIEVRGLEPVGEVHIRRALAISALPGTSLRDLDEDPHGSAASPGKLGAEAPSRHGKHIRRQGQHARWL